MVDTSIIGHNQYVDGVQLSGQISDNYYAISSGNWSDPSIWSLTKDGTPSKSVPDIDNSVIVEGYSITIDNNQSCSNLTIVANESSESSLEISNGTLSVYGQINIVNEAETEQSQCLKVYNNGSIQVLEPLD